MDLKIHTLGWAGSASVKEGQRPGIQFNSLLEIDGQLYDEVRNIRVESGGDTFTTVTLELIPSTIEYVNHTQESWNQLTGTLQTIKNGAGWSLSVEQQEEKA